MLVASVANGAMTGSGTASPLYQLPFPAAEVAFGPAETSPAGLAEGAAVSGRIRMGPSDPLSYGVLVIRR